MENLKLNEAVNYAKGTKKVRKYKLAHLLWPDSTRHTAHTNFSNLANGKSKKIDIAAVPVLCRELGVSADFLFGLSAEPNGISKDEAKALIAENNAKMHRLAETLKVSRPELEEALSLF